jgi:glutamine synthetase
MTRKLTVAALATFFVATAAMHPAAAAPASPSDAQVAPGQWEVARVRCADILNAADDDRATVVMFYYGYLAAQYGLKVIDVPKIADNIQKVMHQCEAKPTMTVPEAFRAALAPHRKKARG